MIEQNLKNQYAGALSKAYFLREFKIPEIDAPNASQNLYIFF
jgi:hypothetical protein